jgi:hypothetical protein
MKPTAELNLAPFVVGNQWPGIPLYTITTPPSGAGDLAEVEIQFRTDAPSSPAYAAKLSASGGEITILSAADWSFTVPPQTLPLGAGIFYQSIKLTDDSTPPQSYTFTEGTIIGYLPATR